MTLKEELEKRGWKLIRVVHFKYHDRIVIQNNELDVSLNLRKKQNDYSIQQIVEALTGGS
jgi:hypothetical protein